MIWTGLTKIQQKLYEVVHSLESANGQVVHSLESVNGQVDKKLNNIIPLYRGQF